jgi:hypothetical protein
MEIYRLLVDIVFWFHWVWIAILILSGFLSVIQPRYAKFSFVLVGTTLVSQVLFLGCPLVALENTLRAQYDPKTEVFGSFICHWVKEWGGYTVPPEIITGSLLLIMMITSIIVFSQRQKW